MSLGLLERPDTRLENELDSGPVAHIVAPTDEQSSHALVMEARVFGFEVEALCGHRFVPQRDATRLPICEECKALLDTALGQENAHKGVEA